MVELKTATEIDALRAAGRVVARALAAVREAAAVGVSLRQLDQAARDVLDGAGAGSPFLGYQPHFASSPFPAVICASVNDAVVHAIPDGYRLREADVVSVDCGATLDGWVGDSAITFTVGAARDDDRQLIAATEQALAAGIDAAQVGHRLGDIGHAVGAVGRAAGYGILAGYGGHGVGRQMHEDPHVPNEGTPGRGLKLREGLVIAIEPMFIAGGDDGHRVAPDGWGLHTVDGSRAAHCEHTIAITADGPRVLTAP